ncbi:MAG: PAS domain S-box protein [Trueperaceae bacterium]
MPGDSSALKTLSQGRHEDLGLALLGQVFALATDAGIVLSATDEVVGANARAEVLLGAEAGSLIGLPLAELLPVGPPLLALLQRPDQDGPMELEVELARRDGGHVPVEVTAKRLADGRTLLLCRDTTVRRTAERVLARSERRFRALIQHGADVVVVLDAKGRSSYVSPSASRLGFGDRVVTEAELWRMVHPRDRDRAKATLAPLLHEESATTSPETRARVASDKAAGGADMRDDAERARAPRQVTETVRFWVLGGWRWLEVTGTDLLADPDVRGVVLNARDVTDRMEAERRVRASEAYYRAIFEKSLEGVVLIGRDRAIRMVSGAALRMLGHRTEDLIDKERSDLIHPDDRDAFLDALDLVEVKAGSSESVRFRLRDAAGAWHWLEGTVTNLLREPEVQAFVVNYREIGDRVRAMEKIQALNEELRRRLAHLQSLRRIDMAITNSVDVRLVLDIFVDQLLQDLGVDAVAVLMYEPATQALRLAVGRGFSAELRHGARTMLGDGPAGRAALEQRTVFLPDLRGDEGWGVAVEPSRQEEYDSYMAVPMLAKGQLQGVIELYASERLSPGDEWLEFLETYADQGAIAIENAQLFRSLERSNVELQRAYDRTIEGWANALDLKDEETAGHSKRVTEMTVRLARRLGVNGDDVVHVQRGALLHDIGKMGIPDEILLKRGPLTTEEFEVMKQHPVYAYELLSPIEFLRPALDIPYCHHERWDGTGYPRGLEGEQIPLAARIFAAVDVFDALTSERPYRPAWTRERAEAFIREGSGKHFDPAIVETFFEVLGQGG